MIKSSKTGSLRTDEGLIEFCQGALVHSGLEREGDLVFSRVDDEWRIVLGFLPNDRGRSRIVIPWFFVSNVEVDLFLSERGLIDGSTVRLIRLEIRRIVKDYFPLDFLMERDEAVDQLVDAVNGFGIPHVSKYCSFDYVLENMRFPGVLQNESLGYFALLHLNGREQSVKNTIEEVLAEPASYPWLRRLSPRRQEEFVADCRKFHNAVFAGGR